MLLPSFRIQHVINIVLKSNVHLHIYTVYKQVMAVHVYVYICECIYGEVFSYMYMLSVQQNFYLSLHLAKFFSRTQ